MLGINPMDVPLYVESFQKKGRLVIDNILETSAAERVGDFLKTMPEDWWFASTLPNRDLNDEMEVHRSHKSNNYYIEKARLQQVLLLFLSHNQWPPCSLCLSLLWSGQFYQV